MLLGLGLGLPHRRRVVISANSAPSAISLSHNEATEDLAVGLSIGTLSTTDADAGDTHTYALVSDVSGKFSISGNELVLSAPLDYETATSHSVTIRSTDSSGNSVQQAFTITVLDFDEVDTHGPLIVDTASGIVDDGGFTVGPIVGDGGGGIKIQGKNGGLAKFIYDIGPPQAGYTYTIRYDPDFTRLSNTGKEAFVGFGFKSNNDFHFTGLKGDGATGLNAFKIYGAGKFNQLSGFTTVDDGAAAHGTQAGPNWIRIAIASDGTTYTLGTSSDGQNWTDEFTASTPSPLTNATDAGQFGIAVFLENSDKGQFSIQITVWSAAAATSNAWGALVTMSSNITATDLSTPSILAFQTEIYDYGSWYDAGSNTRLTVPAGVTYVRVAAQITSRELHSVSNFVTFRLLKNGAALSPQVKMYMTNHQEPNPSNIIVSYPLAVSAGDYFEIEFADNDGSSGITAASTWFSIEKVE